MPDARREPDEDAEDAATAEHAPSAGADGGRPAPPDDAQAPPPADPPQVAFDQVGAGEDDEPDEAWDHGEDPWEWGDEDAADEDAGGEDPAPSPAEISRGTRARLGGVLREVGERVGPGDPALAQRVGRLPDGSCRRCGAHVGEPDRFCSSCGASLRAGAPGASRGGAVSPQLVRVGLPLLLGAALLVVLLLLLRDPLSGVRSDLGDALRPPVEASRTLTGALTRLPAGGSPEAAERAARTVVQRVRDARATVDVLDVPAEGVGDVRRSTDALAAQSRWARAVLDVLEDPDADVSVADRARGAQRSLDELDGLLDDDDARGAVGGTARLDAALGERRRRAAEQRRRRAQAVRAVAPVESLLRDTAEASARQREARRALAELARDEGGTVDPDAATTLTKARTALQASQAGRAAAATRADGLEVPAPVRESRDALAAAYRAEGEEAGALVTCLGLQGAAAPAAAASACREQAATERRAATRAQDAFAAAYAPLRRAAGRTGRPRA